MIQTGSIEKRSIFFRVLSDDQIENIKQAAFDVMSKVGFRIHQRCRSTHPRFFSARLRRRTRPEGVHHGSGPGNRAVCRLVAMGGR